MKKLTTAGLAQFAKLAVILGTFFCLIAFAIFLSSNWFANRFVFDSKPSKIEIEFILVFLLIGLINFLCAAISWAILASRDLEETIKSQNN